jgi:hypothetical protein
MVGKWFSGTPDLHGISSSEFHERNSLTQNLCQPTKGLDYLHLGFIFTLLLFWESLGSLIGQLSHKLFPMVKEWGHI